MDSIVSQNGFILGIIGDDSNNEMSAADSYSTQSGWGLEGTHLTGDYRIMSAPYSPYSFEVDLSTMKITSTKSYENGMCVWEHK